jgi:uncharacterized protein (TIRG00374 family)
MVDTIHSETPAPKKGEDTAPAKSSGIRSFLTLLIKLLIPAGLIYFMISGGSLDFSKIWGMENPAYLIPIPFLMIFGLYVTTLRWRLLLQSQKINISTWNCFRLNFVSYFFSVVLPGGTGGDFLKMYYLGKWCKGYRVSAISTVVFDRIMGLVGLASLGVMAITVLLCVRPELYGALEGVAIALGGSFLCLFFGLFALLSRRLRNNTYLKKIGAKLPFQAQIKKIVEILDKYRDNYFLLFKVWLISVFNHLVVVSFFIFIGFALPVFQDFNYFVIEKTAIQNQTFELAWFPRDLREKLKKEAREKDETYKEHLFVFLKPIEQDFYKVDDRPRIELSLEKSKENPGKASDIEMAEDTILFNMTNILKDENGQPKAGLLNVEAIFNDKPEARYKGQIKILEHNPLPWWLFIVYVPLGMEINAIPISPGGLGVGEAAFESLIGLTLDNKNLSLGAEMMLIWRILFALSSLPGIFFWWSLKHGIEMEKTHSGVEMPGE